MLIKHRIERVQGLKNRGINLVIGVEVMSNKQKAGKNNNYL